MADLAAGVAARVAATAQAQGRAVSLHVAETLTVIALLGWVASVPSRFQTRVLLHSYSQSCEGEGSYLTRGLRWR